MDEGRPRLDIVPAFTLNCPECGQRLTHAWSHGSWLYYRCDTHRLVVLPPDGCIRVDDPGDSAVRH